MTKKSAKRNEPEMNDQNKKELFFYRSLIDNSPDLFYRTDLNGLISYISPTVYELSGYTVEEATGMNMAQEIYLYPEERETFLAQLTEKGYVKNFEAQLKKKDGTVWWASTNARLSKDESGNLMGVEGVTRDITDTKKANQSLFESNEKFRLAFHTSPDSININRLVDGVYIDINQGFTDITGYTREDVIGISSIEINIWKNLEDRNRLVKGLQEKGIVKNLEAQFVQKNGDIRIGLMSASIMSINGEQVILSITKDITELKTAQELIVQTEKMLSVGGLAAGMAHELNNPLAGVLQNVNVLTNRLMKNEIPANQKSAESAGTTMASIQQYMENRDIPQMLIAIKESGQRMSSIIENMLSFARKTDTTMAPHDPVELLNRALELARTDFDLKKHYDFKSIEIQKEFQDDLPQIDCEGSKIQQVLLNLLNNGAHAMFERKKSETGFKPKFILKLSHVVDNGMIKMEVVDNGIGMNNTTLKEIFKPFFTTKPKGIGTGLGLSVSYFIITENHKGTMEAASEPSEKTRFIIHLPVKQKSHMV